MNVQSSLHFLALALATVILWPGTSSAEEVPFFDSGSAIGVIFLANMATGSGSEYAEIDPGAGLGAGMRLRSEIIRFLSIQTEILYVQHGMRLNDGNILESQMSGLHSSEKVRFHFLQVPLLASVRLPTPVSLELLAFVGTTASHLLTVSSGFSNGDELRDRYSSRLFEFGLAAGLGVEVPLSRRSFNLEIRYDHGPSSRLYYAEEREELFTHQALSLFLSYHFKLNDF